LAQVSDQATFAPSTIAAELRSARSFSAAMFTMKAMLRAALIFASINDATSEGIEGFTCIASVQEPDSYSIVNLLNGATGMRVYISVNSCTGFNGSNSSASYMFSDYSSGCKRSLHCCCDMGDWDTSALLARKNWYKSTDGAATWGTDGGPPGGNVNFTHCCAGCAFDADGASVDYTCATTTTTEEPESAANPSVTHVSFLALAWAVSSLSYTTIPYLPAA